MKLTVFIRTSEDGVKAHDLRSATHYVRSGESSLGVFELAAESFESIPGAPFAYWVSDRVRSMFSEESPFEEADRAVRVGLQTSDDERFVRLWTETPAGSERWHAFAKGGAYSPYYADVHLTVNWGRDGSEIRNFERAYIRNEKFYGRGGLTWPLRAKAFSPQAMPEGTIFSVRGYAAFAPEEQLLALLALANARPFDYLYKIMLGRFGYPEFIVGVLQKLPVPKISPADAKTLDNLARRAWSFKRTLDTAELTSHAFLLPALLQTGVDKSLTISLVAWKQRVVDMEASLDAIQAEVDSHCFDLYKFTAEDRAAVVTDSAASQPFKGQTDDNDDEEEAAASLVDASALAANLLDWLVGVAFGRFDVRLATGERQPPPEPEPFSPLPACAPGMLTDGRGLPAQSAPDGYLLELPSGGVLVDDPGLDGDLPAPWDVIRRVRDVLAVVFGERAPDIEAELCELLGVRDLRGYIRRPAGFFADHLSRYSKSRRKAPIYWPLSTASGSYTVWVYYPHLSEGTLYTVIHEHVSPKIAEVGTRLVQLEHERGQAEGREATRVSKRLNDLAELLEELKTFRQSLQDVAALPYKPSLDDGVQISAAPLWRLFLHKPWRNELEKKTCRGLANAEYDWAHLAYAIWPERVREKCRSDRSLAIAHDLESLYEGEL